MATFVIDTSRGDYYVDVGSGGRHDGTEWEVSKDKHFTPEKIIDRGIRTETTYQRDLEAGEIDPLMTKLTYISTFHTPLPKTLGNTTEFYTDLRAYYVRVRIIINSKHMAPPYGIAQPGGKETLSDWVVIGPFDQLDQIVNITQQDVILDTKTTFDLGWAYPLEAEEQQR